MQVFYHNKYIYLFIYYDKRYFLVTPKTYANSIVPVQVILSFFYLTDYRRKSCSNVKILKRLVISVYLDRLIRRLFYFIVRSLKLQLFVNLFIKLFVWLFKVYITENSSDKQCKSDLIVNTCIQACGVHKFYNCMHVWISFQKWYAHF